VEFLIPCGSLSGDSINSRRYNVVDDLYGKNSSSGVNKTLLLHSRKIYLNKTDVDIIGGAL